MQAQDGNTHGEMYWREKYLQLETKMSQFHLQASEIRNKLAVKIQTLTDECQDATQRAETAEEEVKSLQEQLKVYKQEKENEIVELTEELKQEKETARKTEESWKAEIEERNEERTLVHQKIVRLKVWISTRLEEVEDQKKLLFEANERATTSLFEAKRRVQELTAELNDLKHSNEQKLSVAQDDSSLDISITSSSPVPNSCSMEISSSPPPVPPHEIPSSPPPPVPPHADRVVKRLPRRDPNISPSKDSNIPFPLLLDDVTLNQDTSSGTTSETISHVSSIDESKKDTGSHKLSYIKASEITIENETSNDVSSKKDIFTTSPKSVVNSKKKKKSATLPKTRSGTKKDHSASHHHSSLIETFGSITRKFRGFTDSQSSPSRGIRRTQSAGKKEGKLVRTSSGSKKHISTPAISKDLIKIKTKSSGKNKRLSDTLEEDEENSILQPEKMEVSENNSAPASTYLSTSLPSPMLSSILPRTKRSQSMRTPRKRPPTPPLHQVPVWETKIYNLAKTGFQLRGSDVFKSSNHDTQIPIRYHSSKEKTSEIYKRKLPVVPVYTKIFGKIVLLRKTPFPDSSEWSDDDDVAGEAISELRRLRSLPSFDSSINIPIRRNGSPGQARAIKRANSSHSVTSSEGDYSIPPDAISLCSDSSEPEHKLYKTGRTGAPAAASSRVNSSSSSASPETGPSPLLSPANIQQTVPLEKCGFLYKLTGRSLTWRKRWFVLKPNKLQYFISPNDTNKKPVGEITLNGDTNITIESVDEGQTVFQISTEKKTLYFSADTSYVFDDWIRALNIILNRPRTLGISKTGRYRSIAQNKITLKGWLNRSSKDGKKKKLWGCLGNSSLYFYNDESEKEFVGRIVLKDCKISPLNNDDSISVKFPIHNGQQRGDVLLILNDKLEKDAWLYWLTVASGSLSLSLSGSQNCEGSVGTAYERLMTRIMYVAMCAADNKDDSIPIGASSPLWRNQTLTFCRDVTLEPLTTLSSEALRIEAVKLIKLSQQFMNSEIDAVSIDFHVIIAQRIASTCLTHQQLQGEIYAQLIKQCNGKFAKQTTSTSPKHSTNKMKTSTKTNDETAVLQMWKLLSLLIPLFVPHQRMLWLLKAHLRRHADEKSEIGKYSTYCQRALARAVSCGGRTSSPSRTEIVSILLQNPYHHSLPFSIPVRFHNGKYQVMGFDASTTVAEFTQYICQQSGIRLPSISGFALFTDDPSDTSTTDHYVSASSKVCDVISEWERAYRDTGSNKVIDASRMVKVSLTQHMTFVTSRECETEKEKILIAYQASSDIAADHFPVSRELAIELAAVCAQMDEGDLRSADHAVKEILERFYPKRFLESASKQQLRQLRAKLCERWSLLKCSPGDCARVLLSAVRKSPVYGSRTFQVETCRKHRRGTTIWLAVHEQGVSELSQSSMEVDRIFLYTNIATFGGFGDKLVIVVDTDGNVKRHLYSVITEKAAEIVYLMTEYMRATARNKE